MNEVNGVWVNHSHPQFFSMCSLVSFGGVAGLGGLLVAQAKRPARKKKRENHSDVYTHLFFRCWSDPLTGYFNTYSNEFLDRSRWIRSDRLVCEGLECQKIKGRRRLVCLVI